jgi:hypothetical protein
MATIVQIEPRNSNWVGYDIELSDNTCIVVKLDNNTQCCEQFGAYMQVDGHFIDDRAITDEFPFIGAQIESVEVSDKDYTEESTHYDTKYRAHDKCEVMLYVTITTSKGTLVIYLYNDHNGYYEHEYVVNIQGKIIRGYL